MFTWQSAHCRESVCQGSISTWYMGGIQKVIISLQAFQQGLVSYKILWPSGTARGDASGGSP